jgi:hypothetical protein
MALALEVTACALFGAATAMTVKMASRVNVARRNNDDLNAAVFIINSPLLFFLLMGLSSN